VKATRFMRQPFFIDGFKVTERNMAAVAQWCGGEVLKSETDHRRFIRVPVDNPETSRHTEAYVGYWVLKSPRGRRSSFKVYDEPWLLTEFIMLPMIEESTIEVPDPGEKTVEIPTNLRVIPSLPAQRIRPSPRFMPGRRNNRAN
jgi:hypothetical protein